MVAVIKTGHSLHRILNYNENKVREGKAVCMGAENYGMDAPKLTFTQKLNRLVRQAAMNRNVARNSVHISLNFDPSERLAEEQLKEIAAAYMEKIGFGEQPYLVYQHFDAGHPHIHIVTLKVKPDGTRIDMHNIGRHPSEKARKELEKHFGLVRAADKKKAIDGAKPVSVQAANYGNGETKRAITNVVDKILDTYKYASLPEFNAILQLYNIRADRGRENSRTYQQNGLTYCILDARGKKVSPPIKASDFYNKPTMAALEKRFAINHRLKQPYQVRITNTVDFTLAKYPRPTFAAFIKSLQKAGISTVIRSNEEGRIYGWTYIDHQTKCVFNGSELGKAYSAKGILERTAYPLVPDKSNKQTEGFMGLLPKQKPTPGFQWSNDVKNILDQLTDAENAAAYTSPIPVKRMRKKKNKRL